LSPTGADPGAEPSFEVPGLDRVRVDEHLDGNVPLDLQFRDLDGRVHTLREYVNGNKPVLLTFAYHTCPTLCSMVLDAVATSLREVPWTIGQEYDVVTISLDPHDDLVRGRAKRQQMLRKYDRAQAQQGWHFLFGDQAAITRITDAVGYRYFYDTRQSEFAHPAAITFLTPQGRIARYLYGLEFNPADARLALLEASEGRSITTGEHFLLYCYSYDPIAKGYSLVALKVMQLGGLATMMLIIGGLVILWRRDRRRTAAQNEASTGGSFSPLVPSREQVTP
jgi:protein SCO1/2